MSVKTYFLETRPQFLILSPILVILGMGIAFYGGEFNTLNLILSFIGLLLLHISVNTLNDYSDYKTGIDLKAKPTPFSGGSGFLPGGKLSASSVLKLGLVSFFLAVPIGVYFVIVQGMYLLPLFIVGAIFVLWYTSFVTKLGFGMPELVAGLGLGTLPVFGVFLIINGDFTWPALYASIPSGFLVCNLLFLNEFPDVEADKSGGRRTLPIQIGLENAAVVYAIITLMVYIWITAGVLLKLMPTWSLLALLTLPLAIKAIVGALTFKQIEELIPAQGANVMTVLLTQLLLGIGYILARFAG